jgi:CheY-like chemotaxis protein
VTASCSRVSILVIEDDDGAREALGELLAFYDYDVTVARDGTEALPFVTSSRPDLVVMDWRMPGLSGVPLCQALRRRHRNLPIIVVTSADETFNGKPVNVALRKPIDPPVLQRMIQSELDHAIHS